MSQLQRRLRQRIGRLIDAAPKCCAGFTEKTGVALDARDLAVRVERNILAAAEVIIDDPHDRSAALNRPIVADRWPLEVGPTWTEADVEIAMALGLIEDYADAEGGIEPDGWTWPPNIAPGVVGDAIAKAGTPEAELMAEALRNGFYNPGSGFTIYPKSQGSEWYAQQSPDKIFEGLLFWSPVGCAVLLSALAEACPKAPFCIPQSVAKSMASLRQGEIKDGHRPRIVAIDDNDTFRVADTMEHWNLVPPRGHPLVLPFPMASGITIDNTGAKTRAVLTGGLLLSWYTTWALWGITREPDGLWTYTPETVADFRGFACHGNARGGGDSYGKNINDFQHDLNRLCSIGVNKVGDLTAKNPEPLINEYHRESRRAWSKVVYVHAPLALMAVTRAGDFAQVPKAVLRLGAHDAPMASGVASFWREEIVRTAIEPGADGHWRSDLLEALTRFGCYLPSEAKRSGRAYWAKEADRLKRVMRDGDLGEAHIEGEGPRAVVTLTPSSILETAYQGLHHARLEAVARAARRADEIAVRKALPARGRRG